MMRFRVVLQKMLLIGLSLGLFVPDMGAVAQKCEDTSDESFCKTFREGERLFYQGDFEAAKQKFREAFLIAEKIPDKIRADQHPACLKMEGLCYQYLDELDQALALFHEALRLDEQLGLTGHADADPLSIIGWALYLKGEYDQALEYLQRAESLCSKDEEFGGLRARIRIDTGVVHSALGNYSLALKHLLEGLEQIKIHEAQGGTGNMERTRALQHLGDLERSWGNLAKALEHYEDAVRIGREASQAPDDPRQPYNRAYLVEALNELGALYSQLRRDDQAQAAFKEALDISGRLRTRRLIAGSLINLGNLAREQGNLEEALAHHHQALSLSEEIALRPSMGLALAELGHDSLRMGKMPEAIQFFQRALEAGGDALSPEVETRIYSGLAEAYEVLGDLEKAGEYYRRAIDSIGQVRLETLTEDRKIGFWERRQDVFERAISLLYRLSQKNGKSGCAAQAFAYAERARARAFLDLLAEARVHIRRGLSEEAKREEQAIAHEISKIRKKLLQENLSQTDATKLEQDLARAEERQREFEQHLRLTYPAYAALRYPEPLDLEKVQREVLPPDMLLLEFMLGEKESFLWAVSKESCQMIALPGRAEIEGQVKRYRAVITSPPSGRESFNRYFHQAYRLYHLLLKPVEKTLNQYERLILVPDGLLHYLPFESLAVRPVTAKTIHPRLLLSRHRISYASSASVLGLAQAGRAESNERDGELLAYADPVFTPGQLGIRARKSQTKLVDITRSLYRERGVSFDPLPSTREEVNRIARLYPEKASRVYAGQAATESSLKREKLDRFNRLHFATHGWLDEEDPARSGVVFSLVSEKDEDGILQMNEVFNLDLNADVVVLSACQTGLGKVVRGEGIIGLTRAFMYAGASSVVVSLWNVRDSSTAEFMKSFYRRLRAGEGKAGALRQAKLEMIHCDIPAYRFPYFWAAFVLAGETGE